VRLHLSERARTRLARTGLEFLAELLGTEVRRHPDNLEALAELGHALTRLGRVAEGLEVDRRLVRLAPGNSTVHYNLACSLALLERPEESLDALERAIELGYDDAEHLLADDDLAVLRDEERFRSLVQRLRAARSFPV
jgi:tetratricopeptide (TPR) repeat protein